MAGASRLVDYLAVIGFDEKRARHGLSVGEVVQRFPEDDWPDTPFLHGLEVFCQPQGWILKSLRPSPSFFVSTLTDMGADR
uniref:UDENN domain-containing protein n=1 Tax=Plectus sambesii TaxID=2011161 RepID=A0A914WUK9_9BILA